MLSALNEVLDETVPSNDNARPGDLTMADLAQAALDARDVLASVVWDGLAPAGLHDEDDEFHPALAGLLLNKATREPLFRNRLTRIADPETLKATVREAFPVPDHSLPEDSLLLLAYARQGMADAVAAHACRGRERRLVFHARSAFHGLSIDDRKPAWLLASRFVCRGAVTVTYQDGWEANAVDPTWGEIFRFANARAASRENDALFLDVHRLGNRLWVHVAGYTPGGVGSLIDEAPH